MKKVLLMTALAVLASACTKTEKILVLYYSQNGATEIVAEEIAGRLEADIEAIQAVPAYDGDFQATIARCMQERENGVLPEIEPIKANLKDYDIIFLGYPVWFGTYAPPVATLLKDIDLSGKKVVPFCSFGSGGLDSSTRDLKAAQPGAEILPGYGVRAARVAKCPGELDRFLTELGLLDYDFEPLPEFSEPRVVTEEETAIFDAAVDGYPMLHAKAKAVRSRTVPGGTEYIFGAQDENPEAGIIQVYVLAMDGQAPEFTQVLR